MHKVPRTSEPTILKENKKQWTQELLHQLKLNNNDYAKVASKYKELYRHDEIKQALENMYSGLCCFCESEIGISDYEHIEHLQPKSKFPAQSFEWDNLNWCCSKCNINKGNKWDIENPIIDPSVDNPQKHLHFYRDTLQFHTLRGKTTIEHANLNRPKLVEARRKVRNKAIHLIHMINSTNDPQTKAALRNHLNLLAQKSEKYCSFLEHIINRYLK